MSRIKVLYVIHQLIEGGASDMMVLLANYFNKYYSEQIEVSIFGKTIERKNSEHYFFGNASELKKLIDNNNYDLVHFFKTNDRLFFDEFISQYCRKEKLKLPKIIITLCQLPTCRELSFSCKELQNADKIVFANKYAYNNKLNIFISSRIKTQIYFAITDISKPYHLERDTESIRIVRGSTLNKCNDRMIEVLSQVKSFPYKFTVVGGGNDKIFKEKVNHFGLNDKVQFTGHVSFEKWIDILRKSDIFAYHLKMDAYSITDATIVHAMKMEKAVVYLGPPAPTELFEHNKTAMVAKNEKEFIEYLNFLGKSEEKRKQLGQNAKIFVEKNFNMKVCANNYLKLYLESNKAGSILSNFSALSALLFDLKFEIRKLKTNLYFLVKGQKS